VIDPAVVELGKLAAAAIMAFGGLKVALNGMKSDVGEIKVAIMKIAERTNDHAERIAVLEDRGDRPTPRVMP
jgi:hypothetical protein